jgi:hypothetical protein
MKYAVLGNYYNNRKLSNLNYRGILRNWIPEIPINEINHVKLNNAFKQYSNYLIHPASNYINDLNVAKFVVNEYNSYVLNNEKFEIIGVFYENEINEKIDGHFLGWDIEECEHTSLIGGYLLFNTVNNLTSNNFDLYELIRHFFKDNLNANLLFDDLTITKNMINCIFELYKYNPKHFEYWMLGSIEPIGIYVMNI